MAVFYAVSVFSFSICFFYLLLQYLEYSNCLPRLRDRRKSVIRTSHKPFVLSANVAILLYRQKEKIDGRIGLARILEELILSCSDQQVFNGLAYALALRYYQGCTISAYHYNILANLLLISCATHLSSVAIVSRYWENRGVALIRIFVITLVYILTALVFANQNSATKPPFPTSPPPSRDIDSMVFPAACFMSTDTSLNNTLTSTSRQGSTGFTNAVLHDNPSGLIHGWGAFIGMVLLYGLAILGVVFFRFGVTRARSQRKNIRKCFYWIYWMYQLIVVVAGLVVISLAFDYIQKLRKGMKKSGWLEMKEGVNPEDEWATFGQLVPIFLCLMTVYALGMICYSKSFPWR